MVGVTRGNRADVGSQQCDQELVLFRPTRPTRAFEEIITQIRTLISDGHFRPGSKLPPERALASQFGVSRNTLREALRSLEISGLITLKRGATGGAFVADLLPLPSAAYLGQGLMFTDFSVTDLTQVMRSVTLMLFQAALPTIGEEDFKAIEANISAAESISSPSSRSKVLIHFYILLAEASRNKILVVIATGFSEILVSWVIRLGSLSGGRVLQSRRRMVQLLREGDVNQAQSELESYLNDLHHFWLEGERLQLTAVRLSSPVEDPGSP